MKILKDMQIPRQKNEITISTDLSRDSKQWKSAPFPRMLLVNQCVCACECVRVCLKESKGGELGLGRLGGCDNV